MLSVPRIIPSSSYCPLYGTVVSICGHSELVHAGNADLAPAVGSPLL